MHCVLWDEEGNMSFGLDNKKQFILSANMCRICFVPGTVLGTENIAVMEAQRLLVSWWGKTGNKSTGKKTSHVVTGVGSRIRRYVKGNDWKGL